MSEKEKAKDVAKRAVYQLDRVSDRLSINVQPGHVDYISKKDASIAIDAITRDIIAAIEKI